jgi:hypothetical protein
MRLDATVGTLVLCVKLVAQTPPAPTGRLDTAPPPSEKFPAEWYSAKEPISVTYDAPVVGVPFTGTTVMSTHIDGQGGASVILKVRVITRRDSAGRTRIETHPLELEGIPAPGPAESKGQIFVEVNDTVTHCNFTWTEPARTEADKTASVECGPRTVTLQPDVEEMEGKMTRQVAETLHPFPWQTTQIEPLGERVLAGVKTVGIRQTETDSRVKTAPQVLEMWWSPEIKELVESKSIEGAAGGPTLEMTDIKRQVPDAALFYPPAGYKIETRKPAN